MAADVALSQALAYARDLKNLYEVSRAREEETVRAHDKLRAAYQQSLVYAIDLKKTHRPGLARRLALEAGLATREAEVIAQSGLLHDLGKIGVPERILRKPGPLTEEEWSVMRRHPLTGAQIVAPLEFFSDGALIVRHHHEREDGSGYPDGLSGETIPLGARVVAVADVYDALTSDRPYRRGLTHAAALERLAAEAGRTLDSRLTRLFTDMLADAPPGQPVRD